jgi:hypothetical protein
VLTAGHVVFDPVTLSYVGVDAVWWFFQRQAGEYEPPPLKGPRGWYVLEGYAAERSKDFRQRGLNSNESSPESQKLDVAALFFTGKPGAGFEGYGGYLTSDPTGHVWLADTSLKMLLGYPVENLPEQDLGKMHKVGPDNFAFDSLSDPSDGRYQSQNMPGFPGMSGGPVCVLSVNSLGMSFFIPAGVYLGDADSGGSIVRAIDLDVVDLINRADESGTIGTNHVGGGVVLISAAYGSDVQHAGRLMVNLGPPSAIALGAMWRVSPTNYGDLSAHTTFTNGPTTLTVHSANFTIEVTDVLGFVTPTTNGITVREGATVALDLIYTVKPPHLVFDRVAGLGIIAEASNTVYRIEAASQLSTGTNWFPMDTVSWIRGTNWIPGTAPTSLEHRFYRAVWLPD